MVKKMLSGALVAFGLMLSSCSNDDDGGTSTKNLTLNIEGLEELGTNYVYEGWIIVNGAPVSTGTFTSTNVGQTFSVDAAQLASAERFVLSIEPAGETGTAAAEPSATKLVVGEFSGGDTAVVSIGTVADFNTTAPTGTFFLRAPTDEADGTPNNGNDENGIWFGTPGMPATPSLTLPTLQPGWKYEGWVVVDGVGPLSTGTFTAFDVVDDNAGAPSSFSGTERIGPAIPGEDFFNNAPEGFTFPLDIRGRNVVISVEPFPDDSPAPFLLKPMTGTAGNDTAPTTYPFVFSTSTFPSGSVTR